MDFLVHAIAFSDKAELAGRFRDTSRANFKHSLEISCFSFIDLGRRAAEMMPNGGTLLTLTFQGSNKVTPFYNVMGVAKAALESSVRYLANDLGPEGIRVNAISPGPMKTLAGAAIGGRARPIATPKPTPPCAAMPLWKAWGARLSIWRQITGPSPAAKLSMSMADSTSWACRRSTISDCARACFTARKRFGFFAECPETLSALPCVVPIQWFSNQPKCQEIYPLYAFHRFY